MSSRTLTLLIVAGLLAGAGRAVAQTPVADGAAPRVAQAPSPDLIAPRTTVGQPPTPNGIATDTIRLTSPDYQVGPGDVLSIRVSGVREFDQTIRVSNSGRIRVPYVGIVYAAGRTTAEMEREIAEKIRDHELVNEPLVRVNVDQHRAQPVHIVGEVTVPGQFMITGEMYLLDLITRAGGLNATADEVALLYRRGTSRPEVTAKIGVSAEETEPAEAPASAPVVGEGASSPAPPAEAPRDAQIISVNLDQLRDGSRPELNLQLQGGDVLYVPRRQGKTFYIIGDVRNPGAYIMPRRSGVSAAQAIVYAGGPLMTAKNSSGFLMRHDEQGVRQAFPIDFTAIIKGKKPDIPLQADDIIFIPTSAVKTIGVGMLNLVPRLLQQFIIF